MEIYEGRNIFLYHRKPEVVEIFPHTNIILILALHYILKQFNGCSKPCDRVFYPCTRFGSYKCILSIQCK